MASIINKTLPFISGDLLSFKVDRVEIILFGQSSSADIMMHRLISSWIKSEVVIDFLRRVFTMISVKGYDLLWNFFINSPKQISEILLIPDLILFRQVSNSLIMIVKHSSLMISR